MTMRPLVMNDGITEWLRQFLCDSNGALVREYQSAAELPSLARQPSARFGNVLFRQKVNENSRRRWFCKPMGRRRYQIPAPTVLVREYLGCCRDRQGRDQDGCQ
jgi:hypothetical protein